MSNIRVKLEFGVGEGIQILEPLNVCFMGSQKLKNKLQLYCRFRFCYFSKEDMFEICMKYK